MKQIVALYKVLNNLAKTIIGISGFFFLMLLCAWSVFFFNGGAMDNAQLDLKPLVSSPMLAYIWIGTIIIFSISTVIWLIGEIKNGISKARNPQLSAEEKLRSLLSWVIKD